MTYSFSQAITDNIQKTFSYSHAKNKYNYQDSIDWYSSLSFFNSLLQSDPFEALMELEGFQYRKAKNTLDRYGIPYTAEQERVARLHFEVTTKMEKQKSDFVAMYVEDIKNSKVINLSEQGYILTTLDTLDMAKRINELPINKRTENILYEFELPDSLKNEKEQFEALKMCLEYQVSCLIGGAGTGKSFVTSKIIEQLYLNNKKVAILAPTHKAKESLQKKLDKGTVQTIHSYVHNNSQAEVVVVDESGMLSTELMNSLLKRGNEDTQYIFVGDKNQLPPVGYGRPFELIQERFHTYEIKKNRRSESPDIIALGREILGIPQNANMHHNNIEMVDNVEQAYKHGAEVVLTFMNSDVAEINEQRRLKTGVYSISKKFRIGEKIISKTNNSKEGYYNGQLFEVISFNEIKNVNTGKIITIKKDLDLEYNFDYAYALTVHKSQGSEWDVVAYQPSELDSQNIAYVAVTRAKKKLIIIGDGLKEVYPPERKWRQLNENYRI